MDINPVPLAFVTSFHVAAIAGAFYIPLEKTGALAFSTMYVLTGLGITVGYHRLWSHKSYKAKLPWRLWWGFWGTGALQGSILWWSKLHRLHHSFPDTAADPYSIDKGVLWAHCLWMFVKTDRTKELKLVDTKDLKEDPVVVLQHKHYVWMGMLVAFVSPLLMFSHHPWQALLYGGLWARLFTWHSTWCVNSLAHWLGENQFSYETTAKDHRFTAWVTFGEGNHGFHHAFAWSYRNGLHWKDYDPTRYMIELGARLGLCYDLLHPDENEIQKARYQLKDHNLKEMKNTIVWPDPTKSNYKMLYKDYARAKEQGRLLVAFKDFPNPDDPDTPVDPDNVSVYDVTEYISDHPGGNIFRAFASKNPVNTRTWMEKHHMHTQAARSFMQTLKIANLEPALTATIEGLKNEELESPVALTKAQNIENVMFENQALKNRVKFANREEETDASAEFKALAPMKFDQMAEDQIFSGLEG